MSEDLRAVVTALREQSDVMIRSANQTPGIGADPHLWAVVKVTTDTLRQLADRIERMVP